MQPKKNRISVLLILTFILIPVSFLNFSQLGSAISDNDDLEVSIHCELKSNSSEIQSSLMPLGSYTFFQTPNLNTGEFSHDLTKIEVSNIQHSQENQTTPVSGSFSGLSGNQTINSSKLSEYTISAPKDTIIKTNISYDNYNSSWSYTGSSYDISPPSGNPSSITFYDGYWWVLKDYAHAVFKFNPDWTYTGLSYSIGTEETYPTSIHFEGGYWWMVGIENDRVFKYTSNWVYTGTSHDLSSQDIMPFSIHYEGGYWWMLGASHDRVYKYNPDWTYTETSYNVHDNWGASIHYEDGYWWLIGNENDRVFKYTSDWSYTGTSYYIGSEDNIPSSIHYKDEYWWMSGMDNDKVFKYYNNDFIPNVDDFISNVYVNNFTYQILGVNHTESFQLNFDNSMSFEVTNQSGSLIYYFSSSDFSYYNYTQNLKIFAQNLSLTFDLSFQNTAFDYNITVLYSLNSFKTPSEINLQINNNDVIDETFNTGYVYLDNFLETISITADLANIYFVLNITTEFVFYIELDVISKTYLSKSFKLLSNHLISIKRIDLPNELYIKKIYLNTIDLGNSNPNYLVPSVQMDMNSIYSLEVILIDNLYLPLNSALNDYETIYSNSFNSFTSEMNHSYFPGAYNTTYSIDSGDLEMKSEFPNEFHEGNLTDSWSLDYNSSYTNSSYNNRNLSSYLNTWNNSVIPLNSSFNLINGSLTANGSLYEIDDDFSLFSSTGGNYPATYSFTDETVGSDPAGWTVSEAGGTINVISDLDGHTKVVEIDDTSNSAFVILYQTFLDGAQTSGTVEFWIRSNDVTDSLEIRMMDSSSTIGPRINFDEDKIIYVGVGDATGGGIANNVWYHIKSVFDCTSDTYDFYLDGILLDSGVNFDNAITSVDKIEFRTSTTTLNYKWYIDAIGYSWDTDYKIGDNYYWNNYLGNETFENYDLTYFDGNYDGSYSFTNDIVGSDPAGWTVTEAGGTINVISALDGHKKVVELDDTDGGADVTIRQDFTDGAQTTGTYELWVRTTDATFTTDIIALDEGSATTIQIRIDVELFKYRSSVGTYINVGLAALDDTWYHINVVFDCATDTYDLYIDNVKYLTGIAFRNPAVTLDHLFIKTIEGDSGYTTYIDAVGYSWDSNYTIGDNTNIYGGKILADLRNNGWTIENINLGQYIGISGEFGSHKKVLELYDNNNAGASGVDNFFSSDQSNGTIELYMRSSNAEFSNIISIKHQSTNILLIMIQVDKFRYWDGSWNDVGIGALNNTWYHIRIEFECSTGGYKGLAQYAWHLYIDGVHYGDYNFGNNISHVDKLTFFTANVGDNYYYYIDAIGYSWDFGYTIGDNLKPNNLPALNFTTILNLGNDYSEDIIEYIRLYYSYKTDNSQIVNLTIYNFDLGQYDVINSSNNHDGFYDLYFNLNSSYYNSSYNILLNFEMSNVSSVFKLFIDKLKIDYNWTRISGRIYASIQKSINYTFLNYYDSFSDYQKIYNVSIQFRYKFSNYTKYSYLAKFLYQTNENNLNVSGNWYNFSLSVIFNSSIANSFALIFNITNGLLELNNMNYSVWFKCLDLNGKTKLYQYFKLEPQLETLDWYEKTHSRMILNISYVFTNTSNLFNYYNSIDFSLLLFKINVLSESGWVSSNYNYNQSKSNTLSVNLYQILTSNSRTQFFNFSLEIYISGNNSQVTITDLDLYNKFEITSIQLTENPRTDVNSVDFLEFYQSNRSFSYWYYENQSQLNDLYLIHKSTSTTISSFINSSNNRYYFQHSSQTNDLFEVYPDYKPNWQISTSITENTKTTTKIKVDYSADMSISGVSLVLTLTRGDLFETLELNQNQSQTLITLIVPNIDFTTTTQSIYINGSRTQNSTNPHVNYDSVDFNESYYYGNLLLNSYIIDVNPNWNIIHSVVSNTGISSTVKVNYKADLIIENVNISINLKNDSCYNENWTLGSTQNVDYLLTIPNIDFTTTVQILFVEGSSSIPNATISSYESDQSFNRITIDNEIDFVAFLTYPKFTQVFGLNINSSWTSYNVYYGNETYATESLSNTSINVLGSGFDPEITDSYLHFTMKPFVNVDWQYENDIITITINSTMDVDNAFFLYQFDPSGVHDLEVLSSDITINDLSDSGDSDGYLTFNTPRVPKGITIITIEVNFATPLEMLIQSIIIFSVCGIFIGVFYYLKSSEKARNKIKGFLDKKVLSKLNKAKEDKGVNEVILEIKNNKIHLKKK